MPQSECDGDSSCAARQLAGFTTVKECAISAEDSQEARLTTRKQMLASAMSEAEAIEGAKQGDGECFESLYTRHKRRVYSLCLRMTGNVEAAEDRTQDAFLQLHRKIPSFRGDSAFSTWLHRLTVNVVLMQVRKKGLPQFLWKKFWSLLKKVASRRTSAAKTKFLLAQSTV